MAIHSVRIDYTLYSPAYEPDQGLCFDFETLERAKRRACDMGAGSTIMRNFNLEGKRGQFDWWQDGRCWYFDGFVFERCKSAEEKKWVITAAEIRRFPGLRSRRLTRAEKKAILTRLRRLPVDAIGPR